MKKIRRTLSLGITFGYVAAMVLPLLISGTASALSGGGTSSNPYLITDCAGLEEMSDQATAYYKLFSDIDCSNSASLNGGAGFQPILNNADPFNNSFSGTLDGNGFSINHLTINGGGNVTGLFATLSGTVKNLRLTDETVTSSIYTGGLAGIAARATITSVEANGSITGQILVGGLVGYQTGGSISEGAFNGSVSGSYRTGGLVGDDQSGAISNSYANASVSGGVVGGLVGRIRADSNNVSLNHVYAAGTEVGSGGAGGLVGESAYSYTTIISDSFSVFNTGGGSGMVADDSSPLSLNDDYFDQTANGGAACVAGAGASGCTAINTTGSQNGYFFATESIPPLDTWDFGSIWQIEGSTPPTLQGLDANFGAGAPLAVGNLAASTATGGSVSVTWDAPTIDGGSPVIDYEVSYMLSGGSGWTSLGYTPDQDLGTSFADGTTVKFRVAAVNLAGTGTYAETGYIVAGHQPPSSPQNLQADLDSVTNDVDLTWGAPNDTGTSAVNGYLVQYSNEADGIWSSPVSVGASTTSYSVTGLIAGDTYDFRVAATNSDGTSAVAEVDGTTTAAGTGGSTSGNGGTTPTTGVTPVKQAAPVTPPKPAAEALAYEATTADINPLTITPGHKTHQPVQLAVTTASKQPKHQTTAYVVTSILILIIVLCLSRFIWLRR